MTGVGPHDILNATLILPMQVHQRYQQHSYAANLALGA